MTHNYEDFCHKYECRDGGLVYRMDSGKNGRYKQGSKAGGISKGVRMICLNGKYYQEHQIVWLLENKVWPQRAIRHINGNLSDNRIENLKMDSLLRGKVNKDLDVGRLKDMLEYNSELGLLYWKVSPRNRTLPGDVVGNINDTGYMVFVLDSNRMRAHRAAWAIYYGEMPVGDIDHINGVRNDNRIVNLRLATRSQNCQNAAVRKNTKTGVKGVHLRLDTGKYSASISVDKKTTWLGCFDTLEEAAKVRTEAEIMHHPFRSIDR